MAEVVAQVDRLAVQVVGAEIGGRLADGGKRLVRAGQRVNQAAAGEGGGREASGEER